MRGAKKLIDKKVLRDLIPINALSPTHFDEISRKAVVEDLRPGAYVFRKGDRDYQTVYLLEGQLEIIDANRAVVGRVAAGSEIALHPLAHKQPRQVGLRAAGKVTVARVDSSLLDVLLTWDESAGYDVVEIDDQQDDDWMTRMLQSQAFLRLPPSNIQQLLMRLEPVVASAGDVIVRQHDEGDYFYIVKHGRLAVTRKVSPQARDVVLAELSDGACFGEEALVSGTKRNASVTMLTDGTLMRLSKNDFNDLLCASLVHETDVTGAQARVAAGARWLDVRLPGEFDNQAIRDSINVPLSALRERCSELDRDKDYIVCCDTGRRSATGAFVLSQRGFSVFALKNGLMDVPDALLTASRERDRTQVSSQDATVPQVAANRGAGSVSAVTNAKGITDNTTERALIDRLAALESDRLAAQQQLTDLQQRLEETQQVAAQAEAREHDYQASLEQSQRDLEKLDARLSERDRRIEQQAAAALQDKASLESELATARNEIALSRQRLEAAGAENAGLQQERTRLQETLSEIQRSAQEQDEALHRELAQLTSRLETERAADDKRRRELETDLDRVREDYHQLGQRTSVVAGERDAATRELQVMQQQVAELREQLSRGQSDDRESLADAQQALTAAQTQVLTLTQRLEELENDHRQTQQQLDAAGEAVLAEQAQIVELQEAVEAAGQQRLSLESALADAGQQVESLQEQLRCSGQQSDEQFEQLRLDHEEILQQLAERDRQLDEKTGKEQQLHEQLVALQTQGDDHQRELQQQLEQVTAALAAAEAERAEIDQQVAAATKRNTTLEAQLETLSDQHASDLDDTRKALGRAQMETANVQRELGRVMDALRKAEQALESERQEHENEIRRLHRTVSETSGESSTANETLHRQLADAERAREDLQIKLGERSVQLEEVRAAQEKLETQLRQAQESARQAEQQLLETNHNANDEMSARIAAEEQIQQALRDELAAVTAERDRSQERLTVELEELDELRCAVEQLRHEAETGQIGNDTQLQELQQERDAAQQRYLEIQQQVDQLRAEAEVTRGLVDMQTAEGGDTVLREELEQAKKNVDVAVRLRARAEEKILELQSDIAHLRTQLEESAAQAAFALSARDAEGCPAMADSNAATVVEHREQADAAVLTGEHRREPEPVRVGGRLRGLVAGIVLGALGAGGGVWWALEQSSTFSESHQSTMGPGSDAAVAPLRKGTADASRTAGVMQTRASAPQPGELQSRAGRPMADPVAARAGELPQPVAASEAPPGRVPEKVPIVGSSGSGDEPQTAVVPPRLKQPVGSYSEPMSDGGRAPTMVEFQADSFEMGSGSSSANFDERPRHRVNLQRFAISRHEVTFAQYDRFARASGRSLPADNGWGRDARPVISVRWEDAQAYTRWLSDQTGSHYRLPTEAEWEFAARAGSAGRFWWGNDLQDSRANCFDCGGEWAGVKTAPVGSFGTSPFGLSDMAGNVMEWVQDCYRPDYTAAPVDGSAVSGGDCSRRVVRGGGYDSPSESLRSARRDARDADTRLNNLGFRIVRQ